jgi:hypothetical protein
MPEELRKIPTPSESAVNVIFSLKSIAAATLIGLIPQETKSPYKAHCGKSQVSGVSRPIEYVAGPAGIGESVSACLGTQLVAFMYFPLQDRIVPGSQSRCI